MALKVLQSRTGFGLPGAVVEGEIVELKALDEWEQAAREFFLDLQTGIERLEDAPESVMGEQGIYKSKAMEEFSRLGELFYVLWFSGANDWPEFIPVCLI
jgi:hypothetical protein